MVYGFISSLDDETTKVFLEVRRFEVITFIMLEVLVHLHRFCRVEM